MSTVYLLCGKIGSGKTTLAAKLEIERRAFRLSVDDIMLRLFGPHMERDLFEVRLSICKEFLLALTERLLAFNSNVVLDWGFWRKAERLAIRERIVGCGASSELIFVDTQDATILERLRLRNSALPPGTYMITEPMFHELSEQFEPPGPDEMHERVREPA